jgi:hypothetical protein
MSATNSLEDLKREEQEFKNDCNRVFYGVVSDNGNTRYNSKREAQLAFEKMLNSWLDKRRKNLVKTINPDTHTYTNSLHNNIDRMVDTNCVQCGEPTVVSSDAYVYDAECNECNIKRRKREHEEYAEKMRLEAEQYPIIKYCNDIRGIAQYWQIPFEILERDEREHGTERYIHDLEEAGKRIDERLTFDNRNTTNKAEFTNYFRKEHIEDVNTGKITNAQFNEQLEEEWNYIRHRKRADIEARKERDRDFNFESRNSPFYRYQYDILDKIGCKCHKENMRLTGKICKTCKLMLKVREYTLTLFKDAAQGRSSIL